MQNLIDRYFESLGVVPRIAMEVENNEAIKSMVRAGLGASILPLCALPAESVRRSSPHPSREGTSSRAGASLVVSGFRSPAESYKGIGFRARHRTDSRQPALNGPIHRRWPSRIAAARIVDKFCCEEIGWIR